MTDHQLQAPHSIRVWCFFIFEPHYLEKPERHRTLRLSLSRNPDCTQEQTGSRTYMSEKTAKRNEGNRFLHFHVANFFKFMAANLSFTQFVT